MPYADNNGVRIYYEVEGQGSPLVLAHGLTGNLTSWRLQYAPSLKEHFQLIMFDARGHGKSDKPHEISSYGMHMVEDVVAILDNMEIEKAHYFGYSMGGRIGFRIAIYHSDRFHSFILGGASPYRNEAEVTVEKELITGMKLLLADPQAFIAGMEKNFSRQFTTNEKNAILANDAKALIAIVTSLGEIPPLTEQQLANMTKPCLLYCGDADPRYGGAKKSAEYIPNVKFISLPGDHAIQFRADLILPHVKEFLAEVSKK